MDLFVGTSLVVNNTLNGENVLFVYLDGTKLMTNIVLNVEIPWEVMINIPMILEQL